MEIVVIVAGLTAAVIAMAGRIPDPRKVKRALASAKIQSIESLVDGKPAAVRGTVALIEPKGFVVSPWTEQRCVYWQIVFDEVGVGGDSVELGRIDGGTPFLLRSEHGTARVIPDRPRLALHGQTFSRPIADSQPFIALAGGSKLKKPNYKTSWMRITVFALPAGAFVTVMGWCTREPDPEASEDVSGYREQLPTRPVISGTRRAKLMIG